MEIKRFKRQVGLISPEKLDFPIMIIGAGGIGSWATLALAKMGCQDITVVDFDKVEDHNVATQFYKESQVGMSKVVALAENISEFSGVEILPVEARWEEIVVNSVFQERIKDALLISAVDSFEVRKKIFETFNNYNTYPLLYMDSRMGGELFRMFVINWQQKESVDRYLKQLFNGVTPAKEPCTERSIAYNTFLSGSMIAHAIKHLANEEPVGFEILVDVNDISLLERR